MSYLQKAITALPAQSHDLPQKDFGDSSTGNYTVNILATYMPYISFYLIESNILTCFV